MPDDDRVVILCGRVGTLRPRDVVPGAVIRPCATCTAPVFVAPSSFATMAHHHPMPVVILCTPCGYAEMQDAQRRGEPVQVARITPAQAREILDALGDTWE